MGGAVRTDQTRPIQAKSHGQVLQGNVMDDLVIGTLQKSRVDGDKGAKPFAGQAGGKGHRMLLRDTNVKAAGGITGGKVG